MKTPLETTLTIDLGRESTPIEFPTGLIGCDDWKNFVVISHPEGDPLCLLQSLDDPHVSFIIVDPGLINPTYRFTLGETDLQALQYPKDYRLQWPVDGNTSVYCILSVQEEPFSVTANLLGPLVINWQTGLGRQVILSNSGYDTRYLIASASPTPSDLARQPGKEQG